MTGSLSNASEAESLRIRRAAPEDAASLTQIAHEAKRHWGYPEHWIKHWQDDLTISPDFIVANQVFVAEQDDQTGNRENAEADRDGPMDRAFPHREAAYFASSQRLVYLDRTLAPIESRDAQKEDPRTLLGKFRSWQV